MVREVPHVEIDFGDGRVLERTLSGNVATYFTLADGRVFDLLPGLVGVEEFERRLVHAKRFHFQLSRLSEARQAELVRRYHGADAGWPDDGAARMAAELEKYRVADLAKFRVEDPVKDALKTLHATRLGAERLEPLTALDEQFLAEDTEYNRQVRYPKTRALLAALPLAPPASWTPIVYRDLLDIDLADPYLGLAPYVLGGEPGRK